MVAGSPERGPLGSLIGLEATEWAPWPLPDVVESTPSTMADVERRAASGAGEGVAVVAEEQTAGRGRRGRTWESPARAGLWWSLLLRPSRPADQLGWLPLVIGVGVARALRDHVHVEAHVKWPNDVLVEGGKIAGILAERLDGGAVIVGVGINVDQGAHEMPPGGTSIRLLGMAVDRTELLVTVLATVSESYRRWNGGEDVAEEYARLSATLGATVSADLAGRVIEGQAVRLGPSGELVIRDGAGVEHEVSAGDVTLRRMPR
ncbi:MAG: biotin--[acetyl-CoA-carboxylase] ligase [Candidatus Nanopelagicales bacterium]|jgi:BirA family biotin operon repressor/biotin-[acetyl-CoA-carboxylase] ligase